MAAKVQPIEPDEESALTALIYTLERDVLNREAIEALVDRIAPGGRKGRTFDYSSPERAKWAQSVADRLT